MGVQALDKRYKKCCVCGNLFRTKPSHWERRKTCGKECNNARKKTMYKGERNPNYNNRGEKSPLFKGGKRVNSKGYVMLYKPEHPCSDQNGYILEHRYVMSQYLNRLLKNHEIVHHKDHNKQNNHVSNLEITTSSEHTKMHNKEKVIVRCKQTGRITKMKIVDLEKLKENDRGVKGYWS